MNRTHFGVQAAIVLTMVMFVSWPHFRPVRAQAVWRYVPATVQQAKTDDAARYSDTSATRTSVVGFGHAKYTTAPTQSEDIGSQRRFYNAQAAPFYTPEWVSAEGGKINAVIGLARNSLNMPIPYARLALRNIGTGQIEARATANQNGRFSFLDLDPSVYVVELLGADNSIVAASQLIAINRGEVRQTEVRTAASAAIVAATFGSNLTPTLPRTTAVAASSDVTRITSSLITQATPTSGR